MKNTLFMLLLFLLSACASNRFLYNDENGKQVYQANCGGIWKNVNMGDCLRLAGKQCPAGFDIVSANEQLNGTIDAASLSGAGQTSAYANGQAQFFPNNVFAAGRGNSQSFLRANAFGGNTMSYNRYIIYTCK